MRTAVSHPPGDTRVGVRGLVYFIDGASYFASAFEQTFVEALTLTK